MEWKKKVSLVLLVLAIAVLTNCQRSGGDDDEDSTAQKIGTEKCLLCHFEEPSNSYVAGDPNDDNPASPTYFDPAAKAAIGSNYALSVHSSPSFNPGATDFVTCEGCHGPGSLHVGGAPIPWYMPNTPQCGECHKDADFPLESFLTGGHANPNDTPERYFFQGSVGTEPALLFGQPEYKSDGLTPVTKNENIQECSACHSPNTKAAHIAAGDVPTMPSPGCAACHDTHLNASTQRNHVVTRGIVAPWHVVNLKPQKVNLAAGPQYGAKNLATGSWIRPRLYYDWHVDGDVARTYSGYTLQTTQGDFLRLSDSNLCAACHTKGKYLFGAFRGTTSVTATHQQDIFTQYLTSAHADKNDLPFRTFSLLTTLTDRNRPQYPFDMGFTDGGKNLGLHTGANNYACYQCHHGVGSIDYQNAVQGGWEFGDTKEAHILWGDSTVTCITCHEVHKYDSANTRSIRVPVYLSYNTSPDWGFVPAASPNGSGNIRGGVKKMMDLTEIPPGAGKAIICLFCHQGRESGWTVWNQTRKIHNDPDWFYSNPDTVIAPPAGSPFVNVHNLASGALLWSKNASEFFGQTYSTGVAPHQTKNCTGCHMSPATATAGGHTWKPQVTTCQECHGAGITSFTSILAAADYNGNGVVETSALEMGTVTKIAVNAVRPVYGSGLGGTGLLGRLNEALYDNDIRYDFDAFPNFFRYDAANGNANAFRLWKPKTIAAAFNLQALYKMGSALYAHNARYAGQILIDSILAINPAAPESFVRPTRGAQRPATDYRTLSPE